MQRRFSLYLPVKAAENVSGITPKKETLLKSAVYAAEQKTRGSKSAARLPVI
ncbi:hypothetical protein [uncultured Ruminococcus sp.]|uniref:hypothetical protein n=1 Tax=uncultured Ruminococcus sp. TaxID=165186 RepID=UPI0025F1921E|nr:hypothetical protein [uncultured Ruminococcus sp.]